MLTLENLASRGLEVDKNIDQMLAGIWQAFKALEPDLAANIEGALGSSALSALTNIGRMKDRPSFLERLVDADLKSPDEKLILWKEFVSQTTSGIVEMTGGGANRGSTENESLSQMVERVQRNYEFALVDVFKQLKARDLEIASAALSLWDDVIDAVRFLTSPANELGGKTPLELIENGQRDEVLALIHRIEYGIIG